VTDRLLVAHFGMIAGDLRRAIGWSQRELARRAGVSQSLVSAIENGRLSTLTFGTATQLLDAMGSRLIVDATRPFLMDRERQREPVHARCTSYIGRRLSRAGWEVRSEVEIGGDRARGWIDLLAYHPVARVVLVIEVKTEIHDFGALERQVGWYEREMWAAARRFGWRPVAARSAVLVLATEASESRLRQLRPEVDRVFPSRARDLDPLIHQPAETRRWAGRAIAMIDPASRRSAWVRPLWIDGRRTRAPYADYAAFLARLDSTKS
jgi:transcriptional regulator with XRE-family HTH domain